MSFAFALLLIVSSVLISDAQTKIEYPPARKVEQTDDYHGTKISDPFRWLEDSNSPGYREWIESQNKITSDYLVKIPQRDKIKERMTALWNYEKYSAPIKRGNRYFYSKNDGLQNQFVLYVADSINDAGKVLLDPNTLSKDGTVALSGTAISDDGKFIAYSLSSAGSDWQEWHVRDIETGQDTPDVLKYSKFSGASWTKDGKGFFYSRYAAPEEGSKMQAANYFQKLYFHKLGTPQSEDALVYERPDDKGLFVSGSVSEDGKWLIIDVGNITAPTNMIYYRDLTAKDAPILPLVDKAVAGYSFVDNNNSVFYFRTDKDAKRGRIVAIDVADPNKVWREVIPQAAETLNGVNLINNQFVANYLKDASTQIKIYGLDGKFIRSVELPGIGTAGGFGGKRNDTETFYGFSSFTTPTTLYHYDMKTGKSTVFRQPKVNFNPADYEVKQVFYASKDGTKVPMFVAHKKGVKLNGTNPTLLYGYGGFNLSQTPAFSVINLVWMEMGGVYALANIRGGNEYGEEWHEGGIKLKKQNTFDDFIAGAEYLIDNKYTQPSKLAIQGGSNGGLLVGAVLNQRPDLFGAALPANGVMDMLRFHKFTIGGSWVIDYGSPDNPEEFKTIYAYSPLHNIKKGTKYPAVMVSAADHDDRVVPAHSFKYTAALQEAQAAERPVLIRIETKAGHGAGKPTAKIIQEFADKWAFLVKELGM